MRVKGKEFEKVLIESGFSKKEKEDCVRRRRNMFGNANYGEAIFGKESRKVMRPLPILFRKGRGNDSENDEMSEEASDDEDRFFDEEDLMRREDGSFDFVYRTPEIYDEQIPPVALVRNGNELMSLHTEGKSVLKAVGKQLGYEGNVNGAILIGSDVSMRILGEPFPLGNASALEDLRKKYIVEPTPHMFSMFDREGKLNGTSSVTDPVSVQYQDGKDQLFVRPHDGMDWKQTRSMQIDVCRVKEAPVGKHTEFWIPLGVKASSVTMNMKSTNQRQPTQTFVCNVTGEIWIRTDELNPTRSPESSDSDDDSLISMYQRGGNCFVDVGSTTWNEDLAAGVVTAARTPLLNGVTCIALDTAALSAADANVIRDDGGVVCTELYLRFLVKEYQRWRLAIIKRMGGEGEYVHASCLLSATPGKSDRVDKTKFTWQVTKNIQRACAWREFEADTLRWLELIGGPETSAARARARTLFNHMGLVNATSARLSTSTLDDTARATLLEGGVRTRQRCPEVGGALVAFATSTPLTLPKSKPAKSTPQAEPKVEPKVEPQAEPKVEPQAEPKVESQAEPDKKSLAKKRKLSQPDGDATKKKKKKKVAVLHQSIISPPVDIISPPVDIISPPVGIISPPVGTTDLASNLATALRAAQLALNRLQCAMDELPLKMLMSA